MLIFLYYLSLSDLLLMGQNPFQVFSAFGFVQKIATFEKAAGFQVCMSVDQLSFCFFLFMGGWNVSVLMGLCYILTGVDSI